MSEQQLEGFARRNLAASVTIETYIVERK